MARPPKKGLDYFAVDCNFMSDPRIESLIYDCGAQSVAVVIALLSRIYANGYYVEDSLPLRTKLMKDSNTRSTTVNKVIEHLVESGYFDLNLYQSESILTSSEIQKNYLVAKKQNRLAHANNPYWLLKQEVKGNDDEGFSPKNEGFSEHDVPKNSPKEKKSKEKEKKISAPADTKKAVAEDEDEQYSELAEKVRVYYNRKRGRMAECTAVTKSLVQKIKHLAQDYGKDCIQKAIDAASIDDFCQQQKKGFIPYLMWILQTSNFERLLGKWDALREQSMRRRQQHEPPPPDRQRQPKKRNSQADFERWAEQAGRDPTDLDTIAEYIHMSMIG